jgi:hypothetical protein
MAPGTAGALALCLLAFVVATGCSRADGETDSVPKLAMPYFIAHAGGGIDGMVYCNCLEALERNYAIGHRYFELDFCPTNDAHWVAIHDWEKSWLRLFGGNPADPTDWTSFPSLEQFVTSPMAGGYTALTLDRLANWMRLNPDAYVVTDIRGGNIKGLQYIADRAPDLLERFIPQIFHRAEYELVTAIGFQWIIYTLHSTRDSPEEIAEFAATHPLFAVTTNLLKPDLEAILDLLSQQSQAVYLHTFNDMAQVERLRRTLPISGVYTDFLHEQPESAPWNTSSAPSF